MNRIVGRKKLSCCAATLFLVAAVAARGVELGTAFTYQGRLVKDGAPISGTCDLTFELFDAETGGNLVGASPVGPVPVDIEGGLFTEYLDFGPECANGEARWLEITVQCPGDGGTTTLEPRQELTPVPYAMRAAEGVGPPGVLNVTPAGNVGIGTENPSELLEVAGNIHASGWIGAGENQLTMVGAGIDRIVTDDAAGILCLGKAPIGLPADISIFPNVLVGVGTLTPSEKLDVAGNIHASGTLVSGSGIGQLTIDGSIRTITSAGNFDVNVGAGRALRLEDNATSPNVIEGNIFGGTGNGVTAGAIGGAIGGGGTSAAPNRVSDNFGTIGGGGNNQAGDNNLVPTDATYATVGGGYQNRARAYASVVGGGQSNTASDVISTVGGGNANTASGYAGTVGGGEFNMASGLHSTVPGGNSNSAGGDYSFAAGRRAKADHYGSFVWGDATNDDFASTGANQFLIRADGGVGIYDTSNMPHVLFGTDFNSFALRYTGIDTNPVNQRLGFINGGNTEIVVMNNDGNVGIGLTNPAERLDVAGNIHASGGISSGDTINVCGNFATGIPRYISSDELLEFYVNDPDDSPPTPMCTRTGAYRALRLEPGGLPGTPNVIGGYSGNSVALGVGGAAIGGGGYDDGEGSFYPNRVTGGLGTISGGGGNTANGSESSIGGGHGNITYGNYTTIGGGFSNTATGLYSTIGGGLSNMADGNSATVPGGSTNQAQGNYSFAAGRRAKANHNGSFVWGDATDANFASTGENQFLIRASGNVGIGTSAPSHQLTVQSANSQTLRLIGPGAIFGWNGKLNFGDDEYVYIHEDYDDHMRIHALGGVAISDSLDVLGNLSVTGFKAFRIDHPLDPENKYLFHSCVESNEMMNVYKGRVTTDARGDALVDLPSYFEALNGDVEYHLTVIGQFAQAIVAQEVQDNRFAIKTDKPNVMVSWQVLGVRQDAAAKAHPMVVELEKQDKASSQVP